MPELRKKIEADVRPSTAEPFVEVRVGRRLMAVTLELGQVPASEVQVTVTRASVRIRSRTDPSRLNVVLALPMTAVPGMHWARFNHGVCDVLVARAEPSR